MEFTEEYITQSRADVKELLNTINREGADKEGLMKFLEESDFYDAPASSKYHNNCKGGLVDHVLNVYYNLTSLVEVKALDNIDPMSLVICGILHDISKVNFYEVSFKNVKDENGQWHQEPYYSVREDKFLYGNHEENSAYLIRQFIPLTLEEEMAIIHHHAGKGYDSVDVGLSPLWQKYPLVLLLHLADMLATFGDEGEWYNNDKSDNSETGREIETTA